MEAVQGLEWISAFSTGTTAKRQHTGWHVFETFFSLLELKGQVEQSLLES